MNILAIDTTSNLLSLAIGINYNIENNDIDLNSFNDSIVIEAMYKQSELIIPNIQLLLARNNLNINNINLIAYNQGPGSFTGLRIGLSIALGISYTLAIKLLPIPIFALYLNKYLQQQTNKYTKNNMLNDQVLIILDAKINLLYIAKMQSSNFNYSLNPQSITIDDFITYISKDNDIDVYLDATSINNIEHVLQQHIDKASESIHKIHYPHPNNMLQIVNNQHFLVVDSSDADLLYL